MSSLNSLSLAIELATRRRDEASMSLVKAQRALEFGREQLAQLAGYVGETDARLMQSDARFLSGELIRNHYQFMGRLQHAISLQSGTVEKLERQLESHRESLVQAEVRLNAFQKVLALRQSELQHQKDRSEQRQTDEFASLQYARQRARLQRGEAS